MSSAVALWDNYIGHELCFQPKLLVDGAEFHTITSARRGVGMIFKHQMHINPSLIGLMFTSQGKEGGSIITYRSLTGPHETQSSFLRIQRNLRPIYRICETVYLANPLVSSCENKVGLAKKLRVCSTRSCKRLESERALPLDVRDVVRRGSANEL
jgi:hypothetical protein